MNSTGNDIPSMFKNLFTIDPNEKVIFCKRCVMSNQRPRIQFNRDGICSACIFSDYKNTLVDWNAREQELEDLCDKHRKNDGSWDVIVPASGGKDSAYVAYILKEKFKMHPLTVTFASAVPTEIGSQNLYNFTQSGFDNILITPNGIIHQKLSKSSLIEFGDNFVPFAYGQINLPLQIAVKFNIPFIMYGENGDLEYGGSIKNYDVSTLPISSTNTLKEKLSGLPRPTAASSLPPENWMPYNLKNEDLNIYLPPAQEKLLKLNIKEYFFSYFENWSPELHLDVAKKFTGFSSNNVRSEGTYTNFASLDDKTDGFHYYMMFIKQGIGRCTSDASHQIRDKIITREDGIKLVIEYDGEFPSLHLDTFLDYMQLDIDELNKIFDKFRRDINWKKENDQWKLRYQVTPN